MRPQISVIVGIRANPAELERARNVRACLERVRSQNLPASDFEIVLIEQDHAPQLAPEITHLATRYEFAWNAGPYNRGWAFNIGATLAQAPYLFLLDADILLGRDTLSRTLDLLRQGNSAVRPYREIVFLDPLSSDFATRHQLSDDTSGQVFVNPMGGCLASEAALYRRIGGHDERFCGWGWEDREFWERLERATEIARLPDRIFHLHHPVSEMNDFWASSNRDLFFESLRNQRTVADQPFMGDSGKFLRCDILEELAPKFGSNACVRIDSAECVPDGFSKCFGYSHQVGPGECRRIEVIVPVLETLPVQPPSGPRISIVMPTYYRVHTLVDAVRNLQTQTYTNWELILVDNAGDANYYFADSRVKVFSDAIHRGAGYARNSGVKQATGKFVCFFDDDDLMYPNYLGTFVAAFEANPEAGMIRCGMRKPDGWDSFSYATPNCCLRREFASATWLPEHGQDQAYFKSIARRNNWSVENGKIVVVGQVQCAVGFDDRGGLRRGDL